MATDGNLTLLGRLRTVVKKVRFLMNFNLSRWRVASIIGASSSKRQLSFNDRPGLTIVTEDQDNECLDSGSSRGLQRTISFPSEEDDVDKRAEAFIANFYRQLRIERQVSLELRYCRDNSFGSTSVSP